MKIRKFNEEIDTSNQSEDVKEQLIHFLDYVRRYHVSSIPMDKIKDYVDGYLNSVKDNDIFVRMMNNE